jgi:hypothetical protein
MEFRQKLLAQPNETLLSCGVEVAAGVRITVHEFDPNHQHMFLPPLNSTVAKPAIMRPNLGRDRSEGGTNG